MSKFAVEQRRITHRGTVFHFVSYDGHPGNPKRDQPPAGPAWYLMREGRRWEAMPHQPGQDDAELDRMLTGWLDEHVFGIDPSSGGD
ncbi:MAG: hypothetical protein VKI81_06880 [Synechococcaceae cyanobacterium]|nr:hypothetical protein [Synechococcaceae cyanobacterium]